MTIEWNKVTWYSKIAAVILFVGAFYLGYWLGTQQAEKIYIEVPHMVHHVKSQFSPTPIEVSTITGSSTYYDGASLLVHGRLGCHESVITASEAIFFPLPNPYGDPEPYLNIYISQNNKYIPLNCDDPFYKKLIARQFDLNKGIVLTGKFIYRTQENTTEFLDEYAQLPELISEKEVDLWDYLIVEENQQ